MKTLIEIIKPYFADSDYSIALDLAKTIESSGLVTEKVPDEDQIIQSKILKSPNKGQFSDGYHTFNELYEIRKAYNVALFNEWARQLETVPGVFDQHGMNPIIPKYDVHKSWRHHDGELCFGGGWFIVVAVLPSGQISNHYEASDWGLFRIPSYEKAKYEWDGHTTKDVVKRLIES